MFVPRTYNIAVWFSCGAASAVAAKLMVDRYGPVANVRVVNNPVAEEDADNRRFLRDVEHWIGQPIELAKRARYPNASAREVWAKKRYMAGTEGAPCTQELKKFARQEWENNNATDLHVLGFTAEERQRHERFKLFERDNIFSVLIEDKLTKADCFNIVQRAGIDLPRVYKLGYPNANCVGCVKVTSPKYWNLVRRVHPETFADRAAQSREIGVRLVEVGKKRIYLDELDPNEPRGRPLKKYDFDCGIFCEERPKRTA